MGAKEGETEKGRERMNRGKGKGGRREGRKGASPPIFWSRTAPAHVYEIPGSQRLDAVPDAGVCASWMRARRLSALLAERSSSSKNSAEAFGRSTRGLRSTSTSLYNETIRYETLF